MTKNSKVSDLPGSVVQYHLSLGDARSRQRKKGPVLDNPGGTG